MPGGLYEVDLDFRETGTGDAQILPPEPLQQLEWRYVLVDGAGRRAIVRVEEPADAMADDPACRPLAEEDLGEARRSWPRPKLKQKNLRSGGEEDVRLAHDAEDAGASVEPTTVQTVRWRFFLIDVPVDALAGEEIGS